MNVKDRIRVCKTCQNRRFDTKTGIVCGLTNLKPDFEYECKDYLEDGVAARAEQRKIEDLKKEEELAATGGLSNIGITNGYLAGVIIFIVFIAINLLTIIAFDRIFLYTLILPIVSILGFIHQFKKNKKKEISGEDILDV